MQQRLWERGGGWGFVVQLSGKTKLEPQSQTPTRWKNIMSIRNQSINYFSLFLAYF